MEVISMSIYEGISASLKKLCGNNPLQYLERETNWFKDDFIKSYPFMSEADVDCLKSAPSKLHKEVILKFIISRDFHSDLDDDSKLALAGWLVRIWGGIKGIHQKTLVEILSNINKNELLYKNVSSWSKVYSAINLRDGAIYDSRVAYSLNWLLLKQDTDSVQYFHQPGSRNTKLSALPLDTLITLRSRTKEGFTVEGLKSKSDVYLNKDACYEEYIKLLKAVSEYLWGDNVIELEHPVKQKIRLADYPFFTEMLLFTVADKAVIHDIVGCVDVNVASE
jgi:hypothetical protein